MERQKKKRRPFFLLIALTCTGRTSDPTKAANVTVKYRIINGECNGSPIDQSVLNNAAIIIGDTTIIAYEKERKEMFAVTYTLETKQTPWHITMICTKTAEVDQMAKGLIKDEQDKVSIRYVDAEFHINRGGKGLSAGQKAGLERQKENFINCSGKHREEGPYAGTTDGSSRQEKGREGPFHSGRRIREEGKHGARPTKHGIAIGLSKTRKPGVALKPPRTKRHAERSYEKDKPQALTENFFPTLTSVS